jgi:hypothetical protein
LTISLSLQIKTLSGVSSQFDCSSEEDVTTLRDKLEVYLALLDITSRRDSPLLMLRDFNTGVASSQSRSEYWNSHVMNNCSIVTTDGVVAAHAEMSRLEEFNRQSRELCCVHSLFDPHPNC